MTEISRNLVVRFEVIGKAGCFTGKMKIGRTTFHLMPKTERKAAYAECRKIKKQVYRLLKMNGK
jgi:hypothetical protein